MPRAAIDSTSSSGRTAASNALSVSPIGPATPSLSFRPSTTSRSRYAFNTTQPARTSNRVTGASRFSTETTAQSSRAKELQSASVSSPTPDTTTTVTNEGGKPAVETTSTADVSLKPTLTAASGSTVTTSTDSSGQTETEVTSEEPVKVEPKMDVASNLNLNLEKKSFPLPWIIGGAALLFLLSRK